MPTSAALDERVDGPDGDEERARVEARARLRRGRLVVAVVAGVLVVGVTLVALLGGFRERRDLYTPVSAGAVIASGPYEVTLERATVQHVTSSGEYRLVASGTARTTGTTSIRPPTGDLGFLFARSEATREVQSSSGIQLGSDPLASLTRLTPGLPPLPWSVTFTFTRDPGPAVFLAVFGQQYTTPYVFGDEMGWQTTRDASTLTLPVERQPDRDY